MLGVLIIIDYQKAGANGIADKHMFKNEPFL